jgi:low temperature requirement protein LtrA
MMKQLFHAPRRWAFDPHNHRRVTWMELFFDLIFVAAVAQVGEPLIEEYTPAGLFRYAFLFVLIWWAWSGHTAYVTRFDHDDLPNRLLVLLQCFIAAVMAANAKDALDSRSSAGFGAAYAGMRIVLVAQYLRARRVRETRALTTRYATGFGVAAMVWLVSALLDAPARYWLWALALAIDFATPWLAVAHTRRFPPDSSHYPERFGLFTIILLGEFIAAVMRGIESQEEWSVPAASTAFAGMAFAFILRWWYFDVAGGADRRHGRFDLWQYAHLPMFLGIAVAGVGFERTIAHAGGETWMLCVGCAVLTASIAAIGGTSGAPGRQVAGQVGLSIAMTGLAGAAGHLPGVVVVILLLGMVCSQTLLGNQPSATAARRLAA